MTAERRATILVVGVFAAFALTTHVAWQIADRNPITGDEPHYLVVADSIADHRSLEVTDAYREEFDEQRIAPVALAERGAPPTAENSHAVDGPRGLYSVHAVGLPVLLGVPLLVGGVGLAQLVMLAIGAFGVLAAWWASRPLGSDPWGRAVAVGVVTTGMTFVTASTQIYPDVPGGVVALAVVAWIVGREADDRRGGETPSPTPSRRGPWWPVGALAAMPWLHVKMLAPALVLLVAVVALERRRGRTGRRLVALAGPLAASVVGVAAYHQWAFGRVAGPYGDGALTVGGMPATVLLGLYVDQFQGMFVQNPALLAAPLALAPFLRRFPISGAAILIAHLAFVVPNAMHENWYGGFSFTGRFGVAGALVIVPIAVFGVVRLVAAGRVVPRAVVGALAAIQVVQLVRYAFTDWDLYNDLFVVPARYPSVVPPLRGILPILFTPQWSLTYPPNVVAAVVLVALVALGCVPRRRALLRRSGFAAATLAVVVAGVASGDPATELVATGADLPIQRAERAEEVVVATGEPGVVTFGPDVELGAGAHQFAVDFRSDTVQDGVGRWELFADGVDEPLIGGWMDAAPETRTAGAEYVVPADLAGRSFRVVTIATGPAPFTVERVVVRSPPGS